MLLHELLLLDNRFSSVVTINIGIISYCSKLLLSLHIREFYFRGVKKLFFFISRVAVSQRINHDHYVTARLNSCLASGTSNALLESKVGCLLFYFPLKCASKEKDDIRNVSIVKTVTRGKNNM
jgi:hypothetical protein